MKFNLAPYLLGIVLCLANFGVARAQQPTVPTTRILAIGTIVPGADNAKGREILPTEVQETVKLYLDGKIDQWYTLQDRVGVVFILNVPDIVAARQMLEQLPLGRAHIMNFELTPLGPLKQLRQLPGMAAP